MKSGEGREVEDHQRGWEIVATSRGSSLCEEDISVFPPSNHEGLLVEESPPAATKEKSPAISSPCRVSLSGSGKDSRWPIRFSLEREPRGRNFAKFVQRAIFSSLEWIKISSSSVKGGGIWPFGAVFGLAVFLLCSRHRWRREKLRLLLLIKEKDQVCSLCFFSSINDIICFRFGESVAMIFYLLTLRNLNEFLDVRVTRDFAL